MKDTIALEIETKQRNMIPSTVFLFYADCLDNLLGTE
jgi:hypothetical protein